MTVDERLHYLGGFWKAARYAFRPRAERRKVLSAVYFYGWERELAQHPEDDVLTPHQIAEARAWGDGAARALRLEAIPPSPPYPV